MAYKVRSLTFDAKKEIKGKFKPSSTAERDFYRALKKVAQSSGHIVESHVDGTKVMNPDKMMQALHNYADLITPWAQRQAAKMLAKVQQSNARAYKNKAKAINKGLARELKDTEFVGALARDLMNEQVTLIRSLPIEAGLRAQKIALEAAIQGTRVEANTDSIAELLEQQGMATEVAVSRAKLIAVTETARANASINQARAMNAGSSQYRWHNSGDGAVRHAHKVYKGRALQGKIFSWDNPPTLDDGTTGHPGTFPRCRCFAEPVFDDE